MAKEFVAAQAGGPAEWLAAVDAGASWEMLPDAALAEPTVWERLLDRGLLDEGQRVGKQPGRCCVTGCEVPSLPAASPPAELPAAAE